MICRGCQRPIGGTIDDPVVATSVGAMHLECSREAWAAREDERVRRQAETRRRRSEAARKNFHERREEQES